MVYNLYTIHYTVSLLSEPEIMAVLNRRAEITVTHILKRPSLSVEPEYSIDREIAAIPDEYDPERFRAECTFRFRIENFSTLTDSLLSPAQYIRNLPWRIMAIMKMGTTHTSKSLGLFVQCNAGIDSVTWSCNAVAQIRLRSFISERNTKCKQIKHVFTNKENDWGFASYMSYQEILTSSMGYVDEHGAIEIEVYIFADPPSGYIWDSKLHSGYVGLKNQGATCYMNSLLQTLYFTNELRLAIYNLPADSEDFSKSIILALQRLFYELQFSDVSPSTKVLTKSFGWEALETFMQHDVQEFLRVLLDKLESKMKDTSLEGTIQRLFRGQMSSYIKCMNVDFTSSRVEFFYDIQLNVKGMRGRKFFFFFCIIILNK